jgi:hypothetical protein
MNFARVIRKRIILTLTLAIASAVGYGGYYFSVYHNNPVLLEVYTDYQGMTYPQGKVLDIRPYQSGRVEYDVYPPQHDYVLFRFRYWFPRTCRYITPNQVAELVALAEQPDFLAAQDEYPPAINGADSEFRTFITFNRSSLQKNIVLVDYFGDDGYPDIKNCPTSLLALMKKVRSITRAL